MILNTNGKRSNFPYNKKRQLKNRGRIRIAPVQQVSVSVIKMLFFLMDKFPDNKFYNSLFKQKKFRKLSMKQSVCIITDYEKLFNKEEKEGHLKVSTFKNY